MHSEDSAEGLAYSDCLPRNGFGHAHLLRVWDGTYLSNERSDESTHSCHAAAGAQAQRSCRRRVDLKHSHQM